MSYFVGGAFILAGALLYIFGRAPGEPIHAESDMDPWLTYLSRRGIWQAPLSAVLIGIGLWIVFESGL